MKKLPSSAFAACERGTVALLSGLMALPMLIVVAGAIDYRRHSSMQSALQRAADSTVLAAFKAGEMRWKERQRYADSHFAANVATFSRGETVTGELKYRVTRDAIIMSYRSKTEADSVFGELSPFSGGAIKVEAHARWQPQKGRAPHLYVPKREGARVKLQVER